MGNYESDKIATIFLPFRDCFSFSMEFIGVRIEARTGLYSGLFKGLDCSDEDD